MTEATTRTVEEHDPRTLLLNKNSRDAKPNKQLVASVKDIGVLQPITAVRTADGKLRVEFGHRRTLAAIAAKLPTVPVEVIGDEGTETADEIERLVRQHAENTHRVGYTVSEDAALVEQLALYGVTDDKIAKRLQMDPDDVKAARVIAASPLAQAAGDKYELDITQAAAVAEFSNDTERVKALVVAAKSGQFEHVLSRFRLDDERAATRQEVLDALAADGIKVIDRPSWNAPAKRLNDIPGHYAAPLDPEAHKACPAHAVYLEEDYVWVTADGTEIDEDADLPEGVEEIHEIAKEKFSYRPVVVCEDPSRHPRPTVAEDGAVLPSPEDEAAREAALAAQKEASRVERARVIDGNKEWDAAVSVRRKWLREEFLSRKSTPKAALSFIAEELLRAPHHLYKALERRHPAAADLFGITDKASGPMGSMYGNTETLLKLIEGASDRRRTMVVLGLLLAANENSLTRMSWRGDGCAEQRYLRFIIDQGYKACGVERLAAGLPEKPEEAASDSPTEDGGDDAAAA